MTRQCVFCGASLQGQKSNEHIFPRWLQKYLNLDKRQLFHALYTTEGELDRENVRRLTFNSHVSGLVCEPCNSGWMSKLEGQAKILLIPLVDGTANTDINRKDCQTIGLWLFKTTLTLHSVAQQERFIPPEHYAIFYRDQVIPRDTVIAIAHHKGGDADDLFWIQRQGWLGEPEGLSPDTLKAYFEKTYRITIRVGHLAWRIHYWPEDGKPRFKMWEHLTGAVRWIHPVGLGGISWPPPSSVSDIYDFDESLMIF